MSESVGSQWANILHLFRLNMTEATEEMVASLLRQKGFIVATDVKIHCQGETTYGGQKKDIPVDIVAIDPMSRQLIIGEVKSWWGSLGLTPKHIVGHWPENPSKFVNSFKILNDKDGLRSKFERLVRDQYGDYNYKFVLYAGRVSDEDRIRTNIENITMFDKPVELVTIRDLLKDFIETLRDDSSRDSTYNNEIAIATLLALNEYRMLSEE
ncbi:uncharacterized protein METZ01_LOCUS355875 [marine metagenome]|uniref:NERD domain-containing protein n=1 Tax=marine metagenome TaxID=408172 RepID=A0A382S260_9ZZZZ